MAEILEIWYATFALPYRCPFHSFSQFWTWAHYRQCAITSLGYDRQIQIVCLKNIAARAGTPWFIYFNFLLNGLTAEMANFRKSRLEMLLVSLDVSR